MRTSIDRSGPPVGAVAKTTDRAYEAHQLRLQGFDWPVIAERTGYLSAKVAATAVNAFLQKIGLEQSAARRQEAFALELARLDQLQAAYFHQAVAGDLAAANFVLKVITRRCSILGLDDSDDATEQPRTILITGSSEEYIAGLRAIAEAGDEPVAGR